MGGQLNKSKKLTKTFWFIFLIFLLSTTFGYSQEPEPEIFHSVFNAYLYPDGFPPGREALIQVLVGGDKITGPEVQAKVDVVFLIDESGSMSINDPDEDRREAVINLLSSFSSSHYRVAVVIFNSNAMLLGTPGLTTDFSFLQNEVSNLSPPGGFTNIAGAMALANSLLAGGDANHRIALLLTDGFPESESFYGIDIDQDGEIQSIHVPFAIDNDITYHVIHLFDPADYPGFSNLDEGISLFADRISIDTGGTYQQITNSSQISNVFDEIIDEASHTLLLKNVWMDLKYKTDAHEYTVDPDPFLLSLDLGHLPLSGGYNFQTKPVDILRNGESIFLIASMTVLDPFLPTDPLSMLTKPVPVFRTNAKVYYDYGDGEIREKIIPQIPVEWKRVPEFLVRKEFDENTRNLTIDFTNFIPDGPVRSVKFWEMLGGFFEPQLDTFPPDPNFIFRNASSSLKTYYSPYYYWGLGDIEYLETKSVSFNVRYWGPNSGNVDTDFRKPGAELHYTKPDGTRVIVSSSNPYGQSGGFFGDTKVNAALIASPEDGNVPDFLVKGDNNPPATSPVTLSINRPVSSKYIWNDASGNGWLPLPSRPSLSPSDEPIEINERNRLWFWIFNVGVPVQTIPLTVSAYFGHAYKRDVSDYEDSRWTLLGTKVIDFIPHFNQSGAFIGAANFIDWKPSTLFSTADIVKINSTHQIYIKLVIESSGAEQRYINNYAFDLIPVAP